MTTIQEQQYVFKTEQFEGPLEVLLRLVEEQKLSIAAVSLAKVADEFLAYIRAQKEFPLTEVADFLDVAATLILIKSKTLLPSLELTEEEKESVGELERRLALHAQFRHLGEEVIAKHYGKRVLFTRGFSLTAQVGFVPPEGMTVAKLSAAISELVRMLPFAKALPKAVVERVVSLEEKMSELEQRFAAGLKMSLTDVTSQNKSDIIVGFLAVLELVKQGLFAVEQQKTFHSIHISRL
ncbi:MAG: segregation/condensation protein A [Parcubacteria group bacterium]|nr:segregation/condensation protein A [Parcubacteria group bacterium]